MAHDSIARTLAALTLVAALLTIVPGCGGNVPPPTGSGEKKKEEPRSDRKGDPKANPKVDPPRPPQKIDLDSGVGKEAVAFLKALGEGSARADRLSPGFVKMVGLPAELPGDRSKGYSEDAAASWMKRVGTGATFGLPSGFTTADAAVLWGSFQAPGRGGEYRLRLVHDGGTWKVDCLALSSVPAVSGTAGSGPDTEYQSFAASAAAGLLGDRNALPRDDRALALAALLTPALRQQWAPPLGSDPGQGFDYNRGALLLKAAETGGGAESYTVTALPTPGEFRLEFHKTGSAKAAYLMKLARGAAPGQWLVDSMAPQ